MRKTSWDRRVNLGDVWQDDDMEFTARRDAIVARLRPLKPWAERIDETEGLDGEFEQIVEDLAMAEDFDEFNEWWDQLYDWADINKRLWLDIFAVANPQGSDDE